MAIFQALYSKNYRLYFAAQAFSNLGNLMKQVALSWLVYRVTDSVLLLGLVTFSREISAFIFSFFAGVLADRYNKKKLIIACQWMITANAFLLSAFTLLGAVNVISLIILQIIFGMVSGIEMPARQSFVNDLVIDKTKLTNAIALNSSMFNTARIVGPALAGILIPHIGEGYCFLIYSFMGIAVLLFMYLIEYHQSPHKAIKGTSFYIAFLEGANYAYELKTVRYILIFITCVTLLGVSYLVVLPVFASDIFDAGAEVFGYMNSAMGIGSLIGAFYIAAHNKVMGLDKIIFWGACIFSAGLILFSFSPWLSLSLLALVLTGMGRVSVFTGANTLLQTISPNHIRGRILSLYIMLHMGSLSLGSLLISLVAELSGTPTAVLLCGIGTMLTAFWYGKKLLQIRKSLYRSFKRAKVV